MTTIPATVVDALPDGLWFYGNLYRVFGRDVHFCVADGMRRTIEVDGDEVGRGRPIGDVADGPTDPRLILWMHSIDYGWLASVGLLGLIAISAVVRRGARR